MKKRMITTVFLSFFLYSGCDPNSCTASESGQYKCEENSLLQCKYESTSDSGTAEYEWTEHENCLTKCPPSIGVAGCGGVSGQEICTCDVNAEECNNVNLYRCNGSVIERCNQVYVDSKNNYKYAWLPEKKCSTAFASSDIVESGTCPPDQFPEEEYDYGSWFEPFCVPIIKKEFRGKWRRIDYEDTAYFGTRGVTINNDGIKVTSISKIDENMIKLKYYDDYDKEVSLNFVRNSITDASIKLVVKKFSGNILKSPGMEGVGGIDVAVENANDSGDSKKETTDENGNAEINDMTSGEYDISVGETKFRQDINDFLNAGIFTLNGSSYIYKISLDNPGKEYFSQKRNNEEEGNIYDIRIIVNNIGFADATAATVSCKTSDNSIILNAKDYILGTIEPGKNKSYDISIETIPFDNVDGFSNKLFNDVKLELTIKDVSGNEWEDVVFIRVFKKEIPIYVVSKDISNPFILISPHREIINTYSEEIYVPYRTDSKYKLVAQSMSANKETVYSISVGSWDNEKWESDKESFTDVSNYEPNEMESQAKTIKIGQQITSYLHKGDLDFWIIDMSE